MTLSSLPSCVDSDASVIASALMTESHLQRRQDVWEWLASARARHPVHVEHVPFRHLMPWHFRPRPVRLVHDSGRFFSVEGVRTVTDYGPVRRWDQPIIRQPEIGILGLLTRVFAGVRHCLMQAKVEPGNIGGPQISPTLQATLSNYTRAHGGKSPAYLPFFTGKRRSRTLLDQLQSEQGSRFLGKRNRNVVLEVDDDIPVEQGFRWMTLGELKRLLREDNIVNMDTRSVLACIPYPASPVVASQAAGLTDFGASLLTSALSSAPSVNTTRDLVHWLWRMRSTYHRAVRPRGLDRLAEWIVTDDEIRHCRGEYFSVFGARVEIRGREVHRWTQPLIYHHGLGLNGMVTQKIGGVLHFLVSARLYPGNREVFELGSTVSRSDYVREFDRPEAPAFLHLFRDPDPSTVRFASTQSEEGGRFFQYQNRYVILELPPGTIDSAPEGFVWMTLAQIHDLLPHGYFNIEARNIIACLHLA